MIKMRTRRNALFGWHPLLAASDLTINKMTRIILVSDRCFYTKYVSFLVLAKLKCNFGDFKLIYNC